MITSHFDRLQQLKKGARRPLCAIELFKFGVLRCAEWPIETVSPFGAPELALIAGRIHRLIASVRCQQTPICARLYIEIPKITSLKVRRTLLVRRRSIRAGIDEHSGGPDFEVSQYDLPQDLVKLLVRDHQERTELGALRREFSRLFDSELARERAAFKCSTSSSKFQRALMVANPELAERCLPRGGGEPQRPKKSHKMQSEAAILFYLFRAATRPTPGGLWAGVAPIYERREVPGDSPRPDVEFRPGVRKIQATVNLLAFQKIVEGLRMLQRYRTYPKLRLAPSAHREGCEWHYQPTGAPKHRWTILPHDRWRDALLDVMADGNSRSFETLMDQLALRHSEFRPVVIRAAEELVNCGLLLSTLALPPAAGDCWEALQSVADALVIADREIWSRAVKEIRSRCDLLSQSLEEMEPQELHGHITAVTGEIHQLYTWAGVNEPLPRPVVLIDLRAPFEAVCSPSFWTGLRHSAMEVLGFYETHGAAEQLRQVTLRALVGDTNGNATVQPFLRMVRVNAANLEVGGVDSNDGTRELMAQLQQHVLRRQWHWYERVTVGDTPVPALKPRAGFDGTIVFTILTRRRIRAEWGRPHAMCLASRFARLLGAGAVEYQLACVVREWYASWAAKGFEPVEVAGADVLNPNAAVRPKLAAATVSAGGGEIPMADLVVESGPARLRPWLRRNGASQPMVPLYTCTGAIGLRDASSQALYRLSLAHGWEFICRRLFPSFAAPHIPRYSLPSGTVISPARWFIEQCAVERLIPLQGPDQYLAWMDEATTLGLPERVWVVTEEAPDATPLYFPVSSPLAVQCLFARIASRPRRLEFTECWGDERDLLVTNEKGEHCASEVAISWYDPSYADCVFDQYGL